jgi:hypothetical protein
LIAAPWMINGQTEVYPTFKAHVVS